MTLLLFLAASLVPDPAYLALQTMDARVNSIGYRIASQNIALCPNTLPLSGISFHSLGQYAPSERAKISATFGAEPGPRVMSIAEGSPAAKAGVKPNDLMLVAGDARLVETLSNKPEINAVLNVREAVKDGLAAGELSINVQRGPEKKEILVASKRACPSTIELIPSTKRIAAADGTMLQISSAMVEATQGDDELAFILAHEMAHNILQHPARLDRIGRKKANVLATEKEADKLGIRLMAGAGYDPRQAAIFWARYGRGPKHGILSDGTHMRTKDRVALLKSEAALIASSAPTQ